MTAVLFVLVGLKEDSSESGIRTDGIWSAEMAMTGVETAVFKENEWIGLAASKGAGSVEVKVMNVDVTIVVSGSDVWAEEQGLSEHFGAFGTELKHFAHGGVAIDVGVAALNIRIF